MNITKFSVRSLTLAVFLTGASASAGIFDTITSIGSGLWNYKGKVALVLAGWAAVKGYKTEWFGTFKVAGLAALKAGIDDRKRYEAEQVQKALTAKKSQKSNDGGALSSTKGKAPRSGKEGEAGGGTSGE